MLSSPPILPFLFLFLVANSLLLNPREYQPVNQRGNRRGNQRRNRVVNHLDNLRVNLRDNLHRRRLGNQVCNRRNSLRASLL